jgi:hypothetical protein
MAAYNLACMYALQGRREEALSSLEQSIQYGLLVRIGLKISEDEDLKSLHGNPRFEALAAEAKKASAANTKQGLRTQLVMYSHNHRGQCLMGLRENGAEPPTLDYLLQPGQRRPARDRFLRTG